MVLTCMGMLIAVCAVSYSIYVFSHVKQTEILLECDSQEGYVPQLVCFVLAMMYMLLHSD